MVINLLLGLLVVVLWGIALANQSYEKGKGYKGGNPKVRRFIKVDDQKLLFSKVGEELPESVDP
jgi:hypothetical protein